MIYRTKIDGEYILDEGGADEKRIEVTGWYYPGLPGTMINPPEPEFVEFTQVSEGLTERELYLLEEMIIAAQH